MKCDLCERVATKRACGADSPKKRNWYCGFHACPDCLPISDEPDLAALRADASKWRAIAPFVDAYRRACDEYEAAHNPANPREDNSYYRTKAFMGRQKAAKSLLAEARKAGGGGA